MVMQPTDLVRAARSLLVGSTLEGHRTKVPTIREKSYSLHLSLLHWEPIPWLTRCTAGSACRGISYSAVSQK